MPSIEQASAAPPIVIANYDFRPSGTVAKSIEIASAAADAGLPVELWCIRASGPLRDRVAKNIPIRAIARGSALLSRGRDLAMHIPALARQIRRNAPAVFLSGGNHLHLSATLALKMSLRRDQIRFGKRASNSTQRIGRSLRDTQARIRRKFGGADFVAAVSNELADELRGADLESAVVTVPNGVDLDRVARLSAEPFDHPFLSAPGRPLIVAMGRMEHQKGFDILLSAFARLSAPYDQSRLILIGTGKEDAVEALRAQAAQLGLMQRVDFVGYQANPFAIMSRADLFVSASRWEGASNTLIEALACGLPLVATACPTGNREVLEQGPYGTLAPVEDPDALAQAIARELGDPRDRTTQAQGARHWSLDDCMDRWTSLLRREYAKALALRGIEPVSAG